MIRNVNQIAVIGDSGTGKTTLSKNLSKKLNLPVYHIDGIHHLENWQIRNKDERDKWYQNVSPLVYPFGNGINFQLEVSNVEKIYNCLKEHKYNIAFGMEENWYRQDDKLLGNKEFLVQDPDGYLLRFSEDLGTKNA